MLLEKITRLPGDRNLKLINLEKSYYYISLFNPNCWRVSVKSTLVNLTDNKTYRLTKECRAETIGQYPFKHSAKSELCMVFDDKNKRYQIRNNPVLKKDDFIVQNYSVDTQKENGDEFYYSETEYDFLSYENTLELLRNRSLENIYCKLDYVFQNKEYSIFSKVEYLNFKGLNLKNKKNKNLDGDYLQPIIGHVPFEKDNKVYIAYAARYTSLNLEGNLEFRLRSNTSYANFAVNDNSLKRRFKYFLVSFLNFIKVSDFHYRISIKDSKYQFYKKKYD